MNLTTIIDRIDQYLHDYGSDHSVLDISELDGFFAAIGCAPEMVSVSQWLPAIWGGEQHEPEWESEQDINEFINSIMIYYNFVMESVFNDTYEPLFAEQTLNEKTCTVVDEWCFGFLRGTDFWGRLKREDEAFIEDALQPIRLFATDDGIKQLEKMSGEEIEFWIGQVEKTIQRIHHRFLQYRLAENTPESLTPKAGRNDPCPCGSGKKYKKCCLH